MYTYICMYSGSTANKQGQRGTRCGCVHNGAAAYCCHHVLSTATAAATTAAKATAAAANSKASQWKCYQLQVRWPLCYYGWLKVIHKKCYHSTFIPSFFLEIYETTAKIVLVGFFLTPPHASCTLAIFTCL